MVDWLGWSATAVFVSSYFWRRAETLRRAQMIGALMWLVYGVLIEAFPVIGANLLVFAAAAFTARQSPGDRGPGVPDRSVAGGPSTGDG